MAAPIVATNLVDAYNDIFINLHAISEASLGDPFYLRLTTWRDEFFPLVDTEDAAQKAINQWAVPTSTLLSKTSAESWQVTSVDALLNLLQNTIYAARFDGYVPSPVQEAAMVTAFNNAWT